MKQEALTLQRLVLEPTDLAALQHGQEVHFTLGGARVALALLAPVAPNGRHYTPEARARMAAPGKRRMTPARYTALLKNLKKARAAIQRRARQRRMAA